MGVETSAGVTASLTERRSLLGCLFLRLRYQRTTRRRRAVSTDCKTGPVWHRLGALAALLAGLGLANAASKPEDLRIVNLRDGINTVAGFLPDGSAAMIVQAWRANGNAHSYHDWLVLAPSAEGHGAAEVTLQSPESKQLMSLISDSPFQGEQVLMSVRFAFGTVDGRPASLVLQATRSDFLEQSLVDPAIATVRVFRLEQTAGDPGESPLEFRLVWQATAAKRYCHADLALRDVLGVPLPRDFAGVNRNDGCLPR